MKQMKQERQRKETALVRVVVVRYEIGGLWERKNPHLTPPLILFFSLYMCWDVLNVMVLMMDDL